MKMIVDEKGIQYTREDAERLGIKGKEFDAGKSNVGRVIRAGDPGNAASAAANKARTINTGGTQLTAAQRKAAEKAAAEAAAAQKAAANTPPTGAVESK